MGVIENITAGWSLIRAGRRADAAAIRDPCKLNSLSGRWSARRFPAAPFVVLDQDLWQKRPSEVDDPRGVGLFVQYGRAAAGQAEATRHVGIGLRWTGPLAGRDQDVVGVGVTSVDFSPFYGERGGREYAFGPFYKWQAAGWLALKPDLQIVRAGDGDGEGAAAAGGKKARHRRWEPGSGALRDAVVDAFGRARAAAGPPGPASFVPSPGALALDRLVRQSVPAELDVPPQPSAVEAAHHDFVAPAWPAFAAPIRRYLAAKAFANWCAYQGRGFRTVACSIVAALSVLGVEAARRGASEGRVLDEALLIEAFRSADLLLVHLASREDLARRLSEIEDAGAGEIRSALTGAEP